MATGWRFRHFTFEPGEQRLRAGNDELAVGARALDVLRVLVGRAGHLVPKSRLLAEAWPGIIVEENNLQVQVSTLRRVLGADAITTVPGAGYRFEWPVAPLGDEVDVVPVPAGRATLPEPLFPLIGRDASLQQVMAALDAGRLLTLTGPGGIGKTRLAIAAAGQWRPASGAMGIAFCDLAQLADGALVPQAIARSLGVVAPEGDALAALLARHGQERWLLVVDNAEHVRDAVAEAISSLLARAPGWHVLVTSQVPLDLPGEALHRLEPLDIPRRGASPSEALQHGSVALLVALAQAADHRFVLGDDNVAPVIETCRRLDGIPLALQLAAARLPQFGAEQLASMLDQRYHLLVRSGGAVPTRQRTLATALDWSCHLLEPAQREMLWRLGVFPGPFTIADACALFAPQGLAQWQVADGLGQLVARSLVEASSSGAATYRLLESVRLHALAQLVAAADWDFIRHAMSLHEQRADEAAAASDGVGAALGYASAIDLCARLPADAARDARELGLQLKLGPAVQASSSPGCPRCEAIYGRAVQLARGAGSPELQFQSTWGYWQFLCMAGRDREAAGVCEQLGELASHLQDDSWQIEASHARLSTAQLLGDARATLEHAEAAIARYVPERHHALAHAFGGHDPGVCALGQSAVAYWLTGRVDLALERAQAAERLGASFSHAYSQAVGYYYAAMTYAAAGEQAALARAAAALLSVSQRHAMAVLQVEGRLFAGRAAYDSGEREPGLRAMQDAYDEIMASGEYAFVPFYATLIADALLGMGDAVGVLPLLDRVLGIAQAGQGFFVPEVHRLRGEALLGLGRHDEAAGQFACAADLAARQGAASLAARVAPRLAR